MGSPMPMKTMVRSVRPRAAASRRRTRNWSTISPEVRLRSNPALPVAQKSHPIAHPTCDDTQPAALSALWAGMRTDSTEWPSESRMRSFAVPSADTWRAATDASLRSACSRSNRPERGGEPPVVRARRRVPPVVGAKERGCVGGLESPLG